jgi:SAM-dependent methyltransferase
MGILDVLHGGVVHSRRIRVLAARLAELLPNSGRVLDVGTGDGRLAGLIATARPGLELRGIDVLVRPDACIHVDAFDGRTIPHPDKCFDTVLFVDVLHHTDDPRALLAEAARVARSSIVLKDHLLEGLLARPTLTFMDWVGNARHGVALPNNYWPRHKWHEAFSALDLRIAAWRDDLGLYPRPADWVFGRSLHFVARLEPSASLASAPAHSSVS